MDISEIDFVINVHDMNNIYIFSVYGINGDTPEKTMMNMRRIAFPGMIETEKVIVDIFKEK